MPTAINKLGADQARHARAFPKTVHIGDSSNDYDRDEEMDDDNLTVVDTGDVANELREYPRQVIGVYTLTGFAYTARADYLIAPVSACKPTARRGRKPGSKNKPK
jgi:DNA-directed RNA polymerase specialized sigma24 family protein